MESFEKYVCEKLKNAGEVSAKKMFGTYNICLDGVNLGVLCVNKWYLKKTPAGDEYLKQHQLTVDTGIKDNSYIITDFTDEDLLCTLSRITCEYLKTTKE